VREINVSPFVSTITKMKNDKKERKRKMKKTKAQGRIVGCAYKQKSFSFL
jgi:hypothetical protein